MLTFQQFHPYSQQLNLQRLSAYSAGRRRGREPAWVWDAGSVDTFPVIVSRRRTIGNLHAPGGAVFRSENQVCVRRP